MASLLLGAATLKAGERRADDAAVTAATQQALRRLTLQQDANTTMLAPWARLAYRARWDGACFDFDRGARPSLEREALRSTVEYFYYRVRGAYLPPAVELPSISTCQPTQTVDGLLTIDLSSTAKPADIEQHAADARKEGHFALTRASAGRAICAIDVGVHAGRVRAVAVLLSTSALGTRDDVNADALACIMAGSFAQLGMVGAVDLPTDALIRRSALVYMKYDAAEVENLSSAVHLYIQNIPKPGATWADYWQQTTSSPAYRFYLNGLSEDRNYRAEQLRIFTLYD